MAPSGVRLSDEAYADFLTMKTKKKHRYMKMFIENGFIVRKAMVEKTDDQKKDFEEFIGSLSTTQSCFVILDLTVPSSSGGIKGKEQLFVISWCPDTAVITDKMVYASTKQAFLDKLKEGTKNVQANDLTDLDYDEMLTM